MTDPRCAGALLIVDLAAVVSNFRLLQGRAAPAACAAAVKADAYGVGAGRVVPTLAAAGCRTFFVATVDEGIAVRRLLETACPEAVVYVLNGPPRGAESVLAEADLRPVLNSLEDIDAWAGFARARGARLPAAVHIDTGMSRLGLPAAELDLLVSAPERLQGVDLAMVMSHLACADEPDHPLNGQQLAAFGSARRHFPGTAGSLANSSGIFLGAAYHADLVRPGAALYGVNPLPGQPNPMAQVVRLQGKILQVRQIDSGRTVGYGATHRAEGARTIATVAAGYADGYLRSLSNRGCAYVDAVRVPLVGRVSMDLATFDVTGLPEARVHPGAMVDLIGPHNPVDDVADAAGTIGYEILTALGSRYLRSYVGG